MSVANSKLHTLPHPHMVNNAHPVTWTPYAKFKPDWSINKFLAGTMTSYGMAMIGPHPLTHKTVINAHPVFENHIPNFCMVSRLIRF